MSTDNRSLTIKIGHKCAPTSAELPCTYCKLKRSGQSVDERFGDRASYYPPLESGILTVAFGIQFLGAILFYYCVPVFPGLWAFPMRSSTPTSTTRAKSGPTVDHYMGNLRALCLLDMPHSGDFCMGSLSREAQVTSGHHTKRSCSTTCLS